MDALTLLNSEPDLQSFKELFEEWWVDYEFDQRINVLLGQYPYTNFEERIDYELKEEYGTSSRKEVAKIMIDDLETSSEDEAKKLFLQEILSLEKRSNNLTCHNLERGRHYDLGYYRRRAYRSYCRWNH